VGVEVEREGKGEGWVELRRDLIGSEDGFVVEVLMYACMRKGNWRCGSIDGVMG
jgi:hypothetical protein